MHFHDLFAWLPDLLVQDFSSYLADFTLCDVLRQVGLNKLLELDGFLYMFLRLLHMLVPILTDVFNHWFIQGAIPSCITKGMITLLKKGSMHIWEKLDDYKPITLLNILLKIYAWLLANYL